MLFEKYCMIIFLIILLSFFYKYKYNYIITYPINFNENFENPNLFIDYHVIHLKNNHSRFNNIKKMEKKLGKQITIFNAILGDTINLSKIKEFDKKINFKFKYKFKNEIGCYLSHLLLIKSLLKSPYRYTVIFEDDFLLHDNHFHKYLIEILTDINNDLNMDFDILYNANLLNNHGNHYKKNIYYADKSISLHGTHCYIINNKNILKIYKNLLTIKHEIDIQYQQLYKNNKLNLLTTYPNTVSHIEDVSTIRDY
jgi:GR25 family glycosyltransferase involved in LPS biosynthesis